MRKKSILISILLALLFVANPKKISAIVDPRTSPNNRFGIHIIDENDLERAAELINSSGGSWGYVTVVIREDDRNREKWQSTFDEMREKKLIPIIRLATKVENGAWAKPRLEDVDPWVDFLNSLNWVVKNRYVILFNEPNHAKEWGGEIRPDEYALIIRVFHEKLKSKSEDFFILSAGFDTSAPNSQTSRALENFIREMVDADPDVLTHLDGWTSHAYPNPDFSAMPTKTGKVSITGYEQERRLAETLGLKVDSPVFITETGWIHSEGKNGEKAGLSSERVASYYKDAFEDVWRSEDIVAITPFVLSYLDEPFDQFSFVKPDGKNVYPQYEMVKSITKREGKPIQDQKGEVITSLFPDHLVIGSKYQLPLEVVNTGQSIWEEENTKLVVESSLSEEQIQIGDLGVVKPFEKKTVLFSVTTPEKMGSFWMRIQLEYEGKQIGEQKEIEITLIPPPTVFVRAQLWIKTQTSGNDFALLVYDNEDLVKKIEPLTLTNGQGVVEKLRDVYPNHVYRFVITKPGYLPRQTLTYLNEGQTIVHFDPLLPVDFTNDGAFTDEDIIEALKNPVDAFIKISPFP